MNGTGAMYAFLANKTAYNLWFGNHAMGRTETPEAESCSHEFKFATATNRDLPWNDLEELGISRNSKLPIHVAVPEAKRLVSSKTVCAHLRGRKFNGGFVHITGRVYAECPIPALLSQIHGEAGNALYDLNRAVARYQIVDGRIIEAPPLAHPDSLAVALDALSRIRGVGIAKDVLPYVTPNGASPMECLISAMLSAPERLGGEGMPLPVLNAPVTVRKDGCRATRYADVYWPTARVALEYDSTEFHNGKDQIGHDAARRVELENAGIRAISLTNHQLRNIGLFDELVILLRNMLGVQSSPPTARLDERKQHFREVLLR